MHFGISFRRRRIGKYTERCIRETHRLHKAFSVSAALVHAKTKDAKIIFVLRATDARDSVLLSSRLFRSERKYLVTEGIRGDAEARRSVLNINRLLGRRFRCTPPTRRTVAVAKAGMLLSIFVWDLKFSRASSAANSRNPEVAESTRESKSPRRAADNDFLPATRRDQTRRLRSGFFLREEQEDHEESRGARFISVPFAIGCSILLFPIIFDTLTVSRIPRFGNVQLAKDTRKERFC